MKKLVSSILALAMLLSMTVAVSAAVPSSDAIVAANTSLDSNGPESYDITMGETLTLDFPLSADMFDWKNGSYSSSDAVTSSQVSRARLSPVITNKTGAASAIESVVITQKTKQAGISGSTSVIEVKFKNTAVTTSSRDYGFTLYLNINGKRDLTTQTDVSGTIYPNPANEVGDNDYIDISNGASITPEKYARNVELFLGADVTVKLNLSARQRYSGTAEYRVTSSDASLLNKYTSIDDVIVITHTNLSTAGRYVTIDTAENYYVYNENRQYIGRSNSLLPFSTKYYLSHRDIDMGAEPASSTAPSSSTTTTTTTTTSSSSGTIAQSKALSAAKSALAKSKNTSIRYKDATAIAASTLKAMNAEANKVGGKISLYADTMSGSKIMGRMIIPAASADKLSSTINLGIYTDSKNTSDVKSKFEKGFNNKIAVISLSHKGSFGSAVTVVAKPNLQSFNTKTLYLYSYDKSGNKYRLLSNTGAVIDKNGYLNFKTTYGGEIVITDAPLKKR